MKIFISYRREETAGEARALFNTLVARLGQSSVFMDVDSIALGRDFRQVLKERLASCDLVLVIIGKDWLDAKGGSGQRRIEDPEDFVHLEIDAALRRNIPITPVLVQRAQMPEAQHLPQGIKDFAYRNGFELTHNTWESDVQELLKRLGVEKQPLLKRFGVGKQPSPTAGIETDTPAVRTPRGRTSSQWLVICGAVIIVAGILGAGLLYHRTSSGDRKPPAAEGVDSTSSGDRKRPAGDGVRIDWDPAPASSSSYAMLTPALRAEYERLFASARIRPERVQAVDRDIDTIVSNRARYQKVEDETGVPWQVVAWIHLAEGGLDFSRHLHNGDPLSARTTHVPAGRPKTGTPPFTWEESAADALDLTGFGKWTNWSVPGVLYKLEGYNGFGYRRRGINSPYLWAGSNHYTKGRYVADGSFSPTAVSQGIGVAVLLRRMADRGILTVGGASGR
jgi:lysozyme family protein